MKPSKLLPYRRSAARPRRSQRRRLFLEQLEQRFVLSHTWIEQGPGLILGGDSELPAQGNPTTGAVEALAVDPTNANVVYAGTVNGGVWKTDNATTQSPTWTPLTDQQLPFLDINSVAVSPVDPNVIYAGPGPTSSLGFAGAPGFGVGRSLDGGAHWQVLGADVLAGQAIRSIVPTTLDSGQVVLAGSLYSGNNGIANLAPGGGVYRSTDGGTTWAQLSGSPGTGLPAEGVSDLVADPGNPERFYAGVSDFVFGDTGNEGVYRSDDGGQTWTSVSNGLTGLNKSMRILLAVHNSAAGNAVYASVIEQDRGLRGVFRSADQGRHWQKLDTPSIPIYQAGQGIWHGAIVADPNDPNVVYISGDQDILVEGGTVFRGDASQQPGDVWSKVYADGANNTSPHADSRAMVFDDNGNLLEASDGGVGRLSQPDNASTRQWSFISYNLADVEFHSVAYDPLSNIVFGGTQDNGTPVQTQTGSGIWNEFMGLDGGDVAVDADQTAHPGTTIRYTSFQFLTLVRSIWDANNNLLSARGPFLTIVAGPGAGSSVYFDPFLEFYNPLVVNTVDPARLLIGTKTLYESFDQGDTVTNLNFNNGSYVGGGPSFYHGTGEPLVYGGYLDGVANPDVIWAGVGNQVIYREHLGDPLQAVSGYQGSFVRTIVADPQDYRRIFVVDDFNQVWSSSDAGQSFQNITGNLLQLTSFVRALEVVSTGQSNEMLVAGGANGVFALDLNGNDQSWSRLGDNMPNVFVADLHFYPAQNLLLAGTLGRGAWTLTDPLDAMAPQSTDQSLTSSLILQLARTIAAAGTTLASPAALLASSSWPKSSRSALSEAEVQRTVKRLPSPAAVDRFFAAAAWADRKVALLHSKPQAPAWWTDPWDGLAIRPTDGSGTDLAGMTP